MKKNLEHFIVSDAGDDVFPRLRTAIILFLNDRTDPPVSTDPGDTIMMGGVSRHVMMIFRGDAERLLAHQERFGPFSIVSHDPDTEEVTSYQPMQTGGVVLSTAIA